MQLLSLQGHTALHIAASSEKPETLHLLLSHRADVAATDYHVRFIAHPTIPCCKGHRQGNVEATDRICCFKWSGVTPVSQAGQFLLQLHWLFCQADMYCLNSG